MTHLRRDIWGTGLARWRRKSPAALALAVLLIVAQVQTSIAAITNQATAIGSYNAAVVTSNPSSQSVPLAPANGSMAITKTGTLNDDDGTPGVSAGDTVELQGYFRAQDGYFAADHTSFWGCKIG